MGEPHPAVQAPVYSPLSGGVYQFWGGCEPSGGRGLDLALALFYLSPDGFEGRIDPLHHRVAVGRSPFLNVVLHRALAKREVDHYLAAALAVVCDGEPAGVVPLRLGASLHPALVLVGGEVALRVEGGPVR